VRAKRSGTTSPCSLRLPRGPWLFAQRRRLCRRATPRVPSPLGPRRDAAIAHRANITSEIAETTRERAPSHSPLRLLDRHDLAHRAKARPPRCYSTGAMSLLDQGHVVQLILYRRHPHQLHAAPSHHPLCRPCRHSPVAAIANLRCVQLDSKLTACLRPSLVQSLRWRDPPRRKPWTITRRGGPPSNVSRETIERRASEGRATCAPGFAIAAGGNRVGFSDAASPADSAAQLLITAPPAPVAWTVAHVIQLAHHRPPAPSHGRSHTS
jgi:hypothetical protein